MVKMDFICSSIKWTCACARNYSCKCILRRNILYASFEIRPVPDEVQVKRNSEHFVIVWDNVTSLLVTEQFADQPRAVSLFLPTCSPFLNPVDLLMEVKGLLTPAMLSGVPLGGGECWMSEHICRRSPGMDQASKTLLHRCSA